MRPATILITALLLAACATADVAERADGTHFVRVESAVSLPWAQHELARQSSALCPDGFEVLNETSDWGWTAKMTRHIRCR